MTIYYCIEHIPTGKLFPVYKGSSYYEFSVPTNNTPKLFLRKSNAKAFLTTYCKGWVVRKNYLVDGDFSQEERQTFDYDKSHARNRLDFRVVTMELKRIDS